MKKINFSGITTALEWILEAILDLGCTIYSLKISWKSILKGIFVAFIITFVIIADAIIIWKWMSVDDICFSGMVWGAIGIIGSAVILYNVSID